MQAEAHTGKRGQGEEQVRKAESESRQKGDADIRSNQLASGVKGTESKMPQPTTGKTLDKPGSTLGVGSKLGKKSNASKPKDAVSDAAQAAARTLMQTANAGSSPGDKAALEAQMKEMFKKMREFNAMDPDMLSRLWQQERDDHLSKTNVPGTQAASPARRSKTPPAASVPTTPIRKKARKQTSAKMKESVAAPSHPPKPSANPQARAIQTSAKALVDPSPAVLGTAAKSTTVWPPERKAAIADAASRLLLDIPANKDKFLPPADIAAMLDGHPTYPRLCDEIEKRGFEIDRGVFARALLTEVPDIRTKPAKPGTTDSAAVTSNNGNNKIGPTAMAGVEQRILDGKKLVNTASNASREEPHQGDAPPVQSPAKNASHQKSQFRTEKVNLEGLEAVQEFVNGGNNHQETPPSSKTKSKAKSSRSRAARQSLSVGPPTKQDLARKRTFADLIDLTQQQASDEEDDALALFSPSKRQEFEPAKQLPTPPDTTGTLPTSVPGAISPLTNGDQAYGMWSHFTPSNQTTTNAKPVLNRSMPSRPSAKLEAPILPADHPSRNETMIKPLDKYKAIRRNEYNPKTIAHDVLLACGRHPDMRPLNSHLEPLKALPFNIGNESDLSTFRWDLIDPGGPPPGSGNPVIPELVADDLVNDGDYSDDDSVLGDANAPTNVVRQAIGLNGPSTSQTSTFSHLSGPAKKVARPRQRMRAPNTGAAAGDVESQTRPTRSLTSLTPSSQPSGTAVSGYAALRAQQAAQGVGEIKKRGRPVGWRKYMMADPSASKSAGPRPAKGSVAKRPPSPHFAIYKCEWKECSAELHNLATLRRHCQKIHGHKEGPTDQYHCHWKDCGKIITKSDPDTGRVTSSLTAHTFDMFGVWNEHVEQKHISPIAWRLGDGPKGGISGKS